jgi:ABC-2 type transport system ATP-binding protein
MIDERRRLGTTVFLTPHSMDEAQSLADRVAILRDGTIVAEGPPSELAAADGRDTLVTFAQPRGVTPEQLVSVAGRPVEIIGEQAEIRTAVPQRTLYRLTAWAEESGIELAGLEARRPSLEDVFLDVTREPAGV